MVPTKWRSEWFRCTCASYKSMWSSVINFEKSHGFGARAIAGENCFLQVNGFQCNIFRDFVAGKNYIGNQNAH